MYLSFFVAAARSRPRQISWRMLLAVQLLLVGCCCWMARAWPRDVFLSGEVLLVAGIVEGALVLGWRLTQLPKSQSLEFLLASPLLPFRVFLSEAVIGLVRLASLTLVGLPLLLLHAGDGVFVYTDLPPLLFLPFAWGAIAGLGLTAWAYEPATRRWWAERALMVLVLIYLVVGVLAGEKLLQWLMAMPVDLSGPLVVSFDLFHSWNPFAVMKFVLQESLENAWGRFVPMAAASLVIIAVLLWRGAARLQGHYQERHYRPIVDTGRRRRPPVGLRPLSWWAVKRVSEYSGRVNLWLAGGFGLMYALHTVAGDWWPAWIGRRVFETFDQVFGLEGVATALVVLAAVPAAFQYGLWDSNTQDRCRRLELLLLTQLDGHDFFAAALTAAWRRGCGYFAVALVLWGAAVLGGKLALAGALLAAAGGLLMWLLYFSLGFRAFVRGVQAGNLGMVLTVGVPLLTILLLRAGWPGLAALTPPGAVYLAAISESPLFCLPGLFLAAVLSLWIHRVALSRCLEELKHWYETYHGRKLVQ
jgi:hypothetical protein